MVSRLRSCPPSSVAGCRQQIEAGMFTTHALTLMLRTSVGVCSSIDASNESERWWVGLFARGMPAFR